MGIRFVCVGGYPVIWTDWEQHENAEGLRVAFVASWNLDPGQQVIIQDINDYAVRMQPGKSVGRGGYAEVVGDVWEAPSGDRFVWVREIEPPTPVAPEDPPASLQSWPWHPPIP